MLADIKYHKMFGVMFLGLISTLGAASLIYLPALQFQIWEGVPIYFGLFIEPLVIYILGLTYYLYAIKYVFSRKKVGSIDDRRLMKVIVGLGLVVSLFIGIHFLGNPLSVVIRELGIDNLATFLELLDNEISHGILFASSITVSFVLSYLEMDREPNPITIKSQKFVFGLYSLVFGIFGGFAFWGGKSSWIAIPILLFYLTNAGRYVRNNNIDLKDYPWTKYILTIYTIGIIACIASNIILGVKEFVWLLYM